MGVSKNRGTPKWKVKIMENPFKMDDLGGFNPLFSETSSGRKASRKNAKRDLVWKPSMYRKPYVFSIYSYIYIYAIHIYVYTGSKRYNISTYDMYTSPSLECFFNYVSFSFRNFRCPQETLWPAGVDGLRLKHPPAKAPPGTDSGGGVAREGVEWGADVVLEAVGVISYFERVCKQQKSQRWLVEGSVFGIFFDILRDWLLFDSFLMLYIMVSLVCLVKLPGHQPHTDPENASRSLAR